MTHSDALTAPFPSSRWVRLALAHLTAAGGGAIAGLIQPVGPVTAAGGIALMAAALAVGLLAGALAGAVVTLARPRARFDETALVGGLSGVLAGGLIVVACALGGGSLGSERLAHIGPRVGALAIFAPTLLGLSGLAVGLILGLLRRPQQQPLGLPE